MRISLLATGSIDTALVDALRSAGHEVVLVAHTDPAGCRAAVGGASVVVIAAHDRSDDDPGTAHRDSRFERIAADRVERGGTKPGLTPLRRRPHARRSDSPVITGPMAAALAVAGDDEEAKTAIQRLLRQWASDAVVVDLGRIDDLCRATACDLESQTAHAEALPALPEAKTAWALTWPIELAVQAGLIAGAALFYFGVRGLTEGSAFDANRHSSEILRLEAALGIDIEERLQRHVVDHDALTMLANWVYIWGHWPVIAVALIWLHRTNRPRFVLLRNAMFVSGAIGLVIFALYPVAPPRHLPSGFVDTVTELSRSYRVLQPPGLINEFAAVPSLHVEWNLLVGIVVYQSTRRIVLRVLGVVSPVLMEVAVVATANHYVIDGVIGSVVALVGLYVAYQLQLRLGGGFPTLRVTNASAPKAQSATDPHSVAAQLFEPSRRIDVTTRRDDQDR